MDAAEVPGPLRALFTSRVLRGTAAGLLTIAFPYLALTELRTGALVLGLLYAVGSLATGLLSYAVSRFGSRHALRPAYFLSLALLPAAIVLLLLPPSLPLVALASALGGFSATGSLAGGGVGGVAMPLQTAILADLIPPGRRTIWLSRFTFFASLSAGAGTLLGGFLSLETIFAVALALAVASVLAAIPVPVRTVRRGRPTNRGSHAVIRRFTVTGLLNGFSQGLLTPFLIPFFVIVFGIQRPEMAVYSTISSGVGTFAVLLAPSMERRWGFVRSIVGTRLAAAGLAGAMPFLPFAGALGVYCVLPALRVAALPAQTAALMGRVAPEDRSEGAGTNQAARVVAAGGATALGGYSFEEVAIAVPFIGYAVTLAANAVLYIRFFGWDGERIPALESEPRSPAPD
ncbi:MAG: MFS transporter [Thermoplasmata archaeon]